jgi:hypothetical protein
VTVVLTVDTTCEMSPAARAVGGDDEWRAAFEAVDAVQLLEPNVHLLPLFVCQIGGGRQGHIPSELPAHFNGI